MITQVRTRAGRPVGHWYRDPLSCLQSSLATLLAHAGHDPLEVLGLSWEFRHHPGDVRSEEYYWPCANPDDLVASLLPLHTATSRWRPLEPEDPFSALAQALDDGRLPVLAVDNYHLPFRPAFRDVHAAHLVVVFDIDRNGGRVGVSDAQPPAFCGYLDAEVLARASLTQTVADEQDVFFAGRAPSGRWLEVRIPTRVPALTPGRLAQALVGNLHQFRAGTDPGGHWTGLAGLARYTEWLSTTADRADNDQTLVEAYTFGWPMQAQAALHGELLRTLGTRWGVPELLEAGRRVEHVAHRWTAVRLTAAHGWTDPARWSRDIRLHALRLNAAYHEALASVEHAITQL